MSSLYFEYHYPVELMSLMQRFLGMQSWKAPGSPQIEPIVGPREWWSNPRGPEDTRREYLTVHFKLPLSVSFLDFQIARRGCVVEVWYLDRSNNWRPVLDKVRNPIVIPVSESSSNSWYHVQTSVYPLVAKQVQFRIYRQGEFGVDPYSVGLREILIKRNVYERADGVLNMEDEQDVLGNIVSKTIKDWDASKANDQDAFTFWKSGPQPSPEAVVALYLDVRSEDGNPQPMDQLYLDPVYSGQQLNLYYSNDDTVADRKLSPITMPPDAEEYTEWKQGIGRIDTSRSISSQAKLEFSAEWGPQIKKSAWIGVEWTPDFGLDTAPSMNPVFLEVTQTKTQKAWSPRLQYNSGAGAFELSLSHPTLGSTSISAPMRTTFSAGETFKIAAGWSYEDNSMQIRVEDLRGNVVAAREISGIGLPEITAFDGKLGMYHFKGALKSFILKIEEWGLDTWERFLSNPQVYVSPEPVLPDDNGKIPSSSLDNAIVAADWTQQDYPTGGVDHSEFTGKKWIPVWKDFMALKGILHFPRMIQAKYLKLEFTELTEEPYPIYESGIDVSYQVFPISVVQESTFGPRLYTGKEVGGLFNLANINGIKDFNPFSLNSWGNALENLALPRYEVIQINHAPSRIVTQLPHLKDEPIYNSVRHEIGGSNFTRRDVINPYILAQNEYNSVIKAEGLSKLEPFTNIPWEAIAEANPGLVVRSVSNMKNGSFPIRGTDWWIFPGSELTIPASVMERLTSTSTVTERKATRQTRTRFTTEQVHRYETRTLRRDAAIAYFAGVREVVPMVSSFIANQDKDVYDFPFYAEGQWLFSNAQVMPSGAIGQADVIPDGDVARLTFSFQTFSQFSRLKTEFSDSGLFKSDRMWASDDSDQLSPKVRPLPDSFGAQWSDFFAGWGDNKEHWGSQRSQVVVNVDDNRSYDGKRVIRIERAPGAGEAGLQIEQSTNFVKDGLARLCCNIFKRTDNDNSVLIRLVRDSNNETLFETPVETSVGRWVEFKSEFFEVPSGEQKYRLELVVSGEDEDDLFIADLFSEISHLRYFVRLGDPSDEVDRPLLETTQIRYDENSSVVATTPVDKALIQVMVLSRKAFAISSRFVPIYLK